MRIINSLFKSSTCWFSHVFFWTFDSGARLTRKVVISDASGSIDFEEFKAVLSANTAASGIRESAPILCN